MAPGKRPYRRREARRTETEKEDFAALREFVSVLGQGRRFRRASPETIAAMADDAPLAASEADVIRIVRRAGSGPFRDGMTVGDFLRRQPNRRAALEQLARAHRAGTIGIELAGAEAEIGAALAEAAP